MGFAQTKGFATIWIFARLRLTGDVPSHSYSFATIWIFARLRQSE